MIRLLLLALVVGGCGALLLLERRRRERLARVRAAFLLAVPAAPAHGPELKEVALRSGAARMRVPRPWSEEYPDEDRASFRNPGSPWRVLRLSATSLAPPPDGLRALLARQVGALATTIDELPEGRLLLRALDAAREEGRDAVVFRWLSVAPSTNARVTLATFALSVEEKLALDPLTRELVALCDHEVRSAGLAGAAPAAG